MKKVLLYSGGLDSWLINQLWKPNVLLYVNMHTPYSNVEINNLPNNVKVVDLPLQQYALPNSIIPLRNLYLFLTACNITEFDNVEICLGALNGDRINDKSLKFAKLLNKLLKYLYKPQQSQPAKQVKVSMPYKKYSKTELLKQYIKAGGNIEKAYNSTFSCYHPINNKPCLNCKACFRKAVPFIICGKKFTASEKKQLKQYYETAVKTNKKDFFKSKHKEGKECQKAIKIIQKW